MCDKVRRNWRNKKLKLIRMQNDRCWLCGLRMGPKDRTFDHIIPKSKGGDNTLENLRLAHRHCNARRGNVDGIAFERIHGNHRTQLIVERLQIPLADGAKV